MRGPRTPSGQNAGSPFDSVVDVPGLFFGHDFKWFGQAESILVASHAFLLVGFRNVIVSGCIFGGCSICQSFNQSALSGGLTDARASRYGRLLVNISIGARGEISFLRRRHGCRKVNQSWSTSIIRGQRQVDIWQHRRNIGQQTRNMVQYLAKNGTRRPTFLTQFF